MYQFFVEEEQVHSDSISITGGDVNHIKNVLRMKNGEKIRVSKKSGQAYFCHISSILDDEVIAAIDSADETGTELDNHIVLYQGLPKGETLWQGPGQSPGKRLWNSLKLRVSAYYNQQNG